MRSVTTSIRIKPHLRQELELFSSLSNQGMNTVIERALEEFFQRHENTFAAQEALKDIAFLKTKTKTNNNDDDDLWENSHDDSGWIS